MSDAGNFTDDLPPDIRDQEGMILDGYLDEFEALEEFQDAEDAKLAEFDMAAPEAIGPPSTFGSRGSPTNVVLSFAGPRLT